MFPPRRPLSVACACVFAASASAQCADWRVSPMAEAVRGASGVVNCSALWDPDGAGPLGMHIVAAGTFHAIGGLQTQNIAAWDGARWRALGSGVSGNIYAIKVFLNDIYVGGKFDRAGNVTASNVARWQGGLGGSWQALGSGLYHAGSPNTDQWVECLEVYNSQVYAGGTFVYSSPQGLRDCFAAWDGANWRTPAGLYQYNIGNNTTAQRVVNSMQQFNSELVVGGGFSLTPAGPPVNIAAFNGSTFRQLGGAALQRGLDYWPVRTMGVHGADLVIAGALTSVAGIPIENIAAWNGSSWRPLGAGLESQPYAVSTFQSQLVAGGSALRSNGVNLGSLAVWTGSSWTPYASGITGSVRTLTPTISSTLFAGGYLESANGVSAPGSVALWNGTAWSTLEGLSRVNAMTAYQGRTIVAGEFAGSFSDNPYAINLRCANIFGWNGRARTPIGRTDGPTTVAGTNGPINALKAYTVRFTTSSLIVAGEFTQTDEGPANRIALWSESALFDDRHWLALGPGLNASVRACEYFNSVIYAAGDFTASGDNAVALSRIARYDSTNRRWLPLAGSDLNGPVNALKIYNGALYAGGSFTRANGLDSGGLARWNGSAWSVVGGHFAGTVYALEVYNNELVIGGVYPGITGSPNIARYNGTSYFTLGTGGANGAVRSLAAGADGNLYLGGDFTAAGGVAASRVARWSGSAWSPVSGGADATVRALLPYRSEIETGGDFTFVRNGTLRSPGWARFSTDGKPWASINPHITESGCVGELVEMEVTPAESITASVQWRRNGVALANGPTGHGSTIFGATSTRLTIQPARGADNGAYDCILSNDCGSVVAAATTLSLCAADVNCDSFLDFFDYDAFVQAFESGTPASVADFNADGFIDFFDYDDFVSAFESGC